MTFGTRIDDSLYAAGQPSKEQLRELPEHGFRRIIDLRPAHVRTLDNWVADPAQPKTLIHCGSSNRVGAVLTLRSGWLHGAGAPGALEIGRAVGLRALEPAVRTLLAREPP